MAWRRQQPEQFDNLASLGFGNESTDPYEYDALAQAGPDYNMGQQAAPSENIYLGEDVIHTEQGQSFYVHRYSDGSYVPLTPAEVNTRLERVGGLPPLDQSQANGFTNERKVPTEVKIETGITFWFNTNGHPEYVPDAQQALTRQIEGLSNLSQSQAAELVRNGSQEQERWYEGQPSQGASYSGPTFDNNGYSRIPAEELPQNYNWGSTQGNVDYSDATEFAPEQVPARHNSVKRLSKLTRVAGSLVVAAVTAYGVHGGLSWMPLYGPEHQIQKSDFLKNEAAFWSSIGGIAGGK